MPVILLTAVSRVSLGKIVSGGFFGLAPYQALYDTYLFSGDSFDRSLTPIMHNVRIASALKMKLLGSLAVLYDVNLRTLGGGLVTCLFFVSFLKKIDLAEYGAVFFVGFDCERLSVQLGHFFFVIGNLDLL